MAKEGTPKSDSEILDLIAVFGVTGWTPSLLDGYDTESAIRFLYRSGLANGIFYWISKGCDCPTEETDGHEWDYPDGVFCMWEALSLLVAHGVVHLTLAVNVTPKAGGPTTVLEIKAKGNWRSAIPDDVEMTLLDHLSLHLTPVWGYLANEYGADEVEKYAFVWSNQDSVLTDIVERPVLEGHIEILSTLHDSRRDCQYILNRWSHLSDDARRKIRLLAEESSGEDQTNAEETPRESMVDDSLCLEQKSTPLVPISSSIELTVPLQAEPAPLFGADRLLDTTEKGNTEISHDMTLPSEGKPVERSEPPAVREPNWSKPCSKTQVAKHLGISRGTLNTLLKEKPRLVRQLREGKTSGAWQFDRNDPVFQRLP